MIAPPEQTVHHDHEDTEHGVTRHFRIFRLREHDRHDHQDLEADD